MDSLNSVNVGKYFSFDTGIDSLLRDSTLTAEEKLREFDEEAESLGKVTINNANDILKAMTEIIHINYLLRTPNYLTDLEVQVLDSIANICPDLYGASVYMARYLLDKNDFNTVLFIDNCNSENSRVFNPFLGKNLNEVVEVSVVPNSNSGQFACKFNSNKFMDKYFNVSMVNTLGAKVFEDLVYVDGAEIKLTNLYLTPGFYIVKGMSENFSFTTKVLIVY